MSGSVPGQFVSGGKRGEPSVGYRPVESRELRGRELRAAGGRRPRHAAPCRRPRSTRCTAGCSLRAARTRSRAAATHRPPERASSSEDQPQASACLLISRKGSGEPLAWARAPHGPHRARLRGPRRLRRRRQQPARARPTSLLHPAKLTAKAPQLFTATFKTTKGTFQIEAHRTWAPKGADRFYNLVKSGFFDGVIFFRVVPRFVVQFGISPYPRCRLPGRTRRSPTTS